jgi:hypothetical protein
LGGLELLGYSGIKSNPGAIKDAFQKVYEHIDQLLTSEEKDTMNYNPVMLEHALCKLKKLREYLPSSVTIY